jgi:hypothetical protein
MLFITNINLSKAHVKLEYPNGGEVFSVYETITISWTITIDHGDCNWDLLFSTNAGATWDTIVKNIPKTTYSYNWSTGNNLTTEGQIRIVQDNTSYVNIWDDSDNFTISLTAGIIDDQISKDILTIDPPYPNPGSGAVKLSFSISKSSNVTIEMFDHLGRKLETLMDKHLPAGNHKITWDPERVESGYYFCRFTMGAHTQIRRLVRTKVL